VGRGTHGDGVTITVSVGVTQLAADAAAPPDTLDLVLERADKALYQAKGAGRNSVVTSEGETVPPAATTASLRVVV
jgi:GGDEF domain-containing protein